MRLLNQKLFRKWIKNNKFGEASKKSSSIKHAGQRYMCGNNTDSKTLKRRRGRAVLSQHPPARQRKALKLEIPATTEWTEREGTCLGRRNCPFSALMHLFTFLYCTLSLLSSFFPFHSSSAVVSSRFLSSSGPVFIPFFSACPCLGFFRSCVSVSVWSACDAYERTPECRGVPNHVLAWPLNKLIFYGCTALPVLLLLKGLHPVPAAFDLVVIRTGSESCAHMCLWEYTVVWSISNSGLTLFPVQLRRGKRSIGGWKGIQKIGGEGKGGMLMYLRQTNGRDK